MIYLNLGRRFTGKTTLGYYLVSRVPTRVIFDPRGELRAVRGGRPVQTPDEARMPELFAALRVPDGPDQILVTPAHRVDLAFADFAGHVRTLVQDEPTRELGVLVDEVRFVDLREENFDWVLRCAAVDRVHIVMTGHRPVDVHPDIRAIADYWLLFQTSHDRDLELIADHCGRPTADVVRTLKVREFVAWDDRVGKRRIVRDASAWYVPLRPSVPDRDAGRVNPLSTLPVSEPVDTSKLFG